MQNKKLRRPQAKSRFQPSGGPGFARKRPPQMHPALQAALTFVIPWLVVQLAGLFLFLVLPNWFSLIIALIYLINGHHAGSIYRRRALRDPRMRENCRNAGAAAGLTLSIGGWILCAIILGVLGLFTGGLAWLGAGTILCVGPVEVAVALFLGAIGGATAA